jgi:phosphoribosylformylglycinamidine synthase
VYQQYDHQVRTNTAVLPGSDAAVLRIRGTNKAIGITTDCNGRYCYLNPYNGGAIAVAEAARNLPFSGAKPLGLTDCLNFGNPYKPEVFYQMKQAVEGLAQACKVLEVPVISGNVSLYNESLTHSVYPTPLIGMVGLIEDLSHITTQWFKQAGDVVFLAGDIRSQPDIGGSEYLKAVHGQVNGDAPAIDLEAEKKLHDFVRDAIRAGLVRSAHDCSEGGLAVALAECCFTPPLDPLLNKEGTGLVADLSGLPGRGDFKLFAETQTRVVLSSKAEDAEKLASLAKKQGVDILKLGTVGGEKLVIKDLIDIPVAEARKTWEEAIPNMMK